ncbi:hypothetical protein CRE_01254 [Caenorhabditis remanei]|uniref:Uncharacterized protein n=1 Tax=Caenorhabditis remanei TaxID=31234 RepID=E3N9L1_CAERE|nr:hypothetical protein CRE_01254 [Caenorhabditis remanei]
MSDMDSPSQEDPRIQEITLKYFNDVAFYRRLQLERNQERFDDLLMEKNNYREKLADSQKNLEAANKRNGLFNEHYWKLVEVKKEQEMEELRNELKKFQKHHVKEIQELETKLAASREESARKIQELQKKHDKDIGGKDLKIQTLEFELSAVQKKSSDKVLELQEQHDKKLSGKDLEIQQLEIKLAAAKKEITDKTQEVQEKLDKVSVKDTKQIIPNHENNFQEKKCEEPTQLHIDLGKLYMDLQEAKKPQEALMARLAAKGQEIIYISEQHKAKLAAKDSEIQRLTEMVQHGDEKNENLQEVIDKLQKMMDAKDREIRATNERVADLEAELKGGRDGQLE